MARAAIEDSKCGAALGQDETVANDRSEASEIRQQQDAGNLTVVSTCIVPKADDDIREMPARDPTLIR